MAALDNTPVNKNFLNPLNFKFQIKRAPNVNFFIQKINIPSLALPSIEIPTLFVPLQVQQTHMVYGDLTVSFKVDEDLQNYFEIHNWIRALGFPSKFSEYAKIQTANPLTGESLTSEISLVILNALKNPNYEFVFHDAFPISLSDVDFDTTYDDVDYVSASVTFKYTLFDVKQIST
jgi:hypothetical protein